MLLDKLQNVENRYLELEKLLSESDAAKNREQFAADSKEFSDLKPLVEKYREYKNALNAISEAENMLKDEGMKELANEEIKAQTAIKEALTKELEVLLIPKDPLDDKNILLEIRAGTGGEEAALFAGELLRMYLRYAERKGWKTEIMDENPTGLGGYKEVIVNIRGSVDPAAAFGLWDALDPVAAGLNAVMGNRHGLVHNEKISPFSTQVNDHGHGRISADKRPL